MHASWRIPRQFWRWSRLFLHGRRIIRSRTRTGCLSQVSWLHIFHDSPTDRSLDITLQQVRLLIAEEEKARAEAGSSVTHDVTAGAFILLGMDIHNLQYVHMQVMLFVHV